MNLEQYIKLRCDLNNKDYQEIKDSFEIGRGFTKIDKTVRNKEGEVKYIIKYSLRDYGDDVKDEKYRYNATVSTTFFIRRGDIEALESESTIRKYDTFSMYYHFSYYQNPSTVEDMFENTWQNLAVFSNNPYPKSGI